MTETYDLIVIGASPAGKSAAELATAFGRRALIVERHQPGGVVTTTEGAPTKTLREAALYLTGFRQEEVYGVRAAVPLEVALPIIGKRTAQVRSFLQGSLSAASCDSQATERGWGLGAGGRGSRELELPRLPTPDPQSPRSQSASRVVLTKPPGAAMSVSLPPNPARSRSWRRGRTTSVGRAGGRYSLVASRSGSGVPTLARRAPIHS
jgi:hypothetical protein